MLSKAHHLRSSWGVPRKSASPRHRGRCRRSDDDPDAAGIRTQIRTHELRCRLPRTRHPPQCSPRHYGCGAETSGGKGRRAIIETVRVTLPSRLIRSKMNFSVKHLEVEKTSEMRPKTKASRLLCRAVICPYLQ